MLAAAVMASGLRWIIWSGVQQRLVTGAIGAIGVPLRKFVVCYLRSRSVTHAADTLFFVETLTNHCCYDDRTR